jgi:hypothetical protein
MIPTRILVLSAAMLLASCATENVDEEVEQKLGEFFNPCLAAGRPAYSAEHVDCVVASYWERQRQQERLRYAVMSPPPLSAFPPASPTPARQAAPAVQLPPPAVAPPPPPPPAVEPPRNPETGLYPGANIYFSAAP